jgi:uncharacterized membrane protein YphA (DoxX/SURF4 family)
LTIGGTFFVHGTQKLFGWFGGYGPDGTGQFFEWLGLRPGRRNAIAAGATEAGGGVLVALGSATPLAAAGLAAVMITALRTAVWKEGIKPATGEFEVLLAAGALALTETPWHTVARLRARDRTPRGRVGARRTWRRRGRLGDRGRGGSATSRVAGGGGAGRRSGETCGAPGTRGDRDLSRAIPRR